MKKDTNKHFIDLSLTDFANSTSNDSIAPGGGSVAAYVGALGAALGTMVANLSAGKKGWEEKSTYFSDWAKKGELFQNKLLFLVDEDSKAYSKIIEAYRMPKKSDDEKKIRRQAIEDATKYAIETPYQTMEAAHNSMKLIQSMVKEGIPNAISDAAVGVLCARTAVVAAYFNVRINAKGLKDKKFSEEIIAKAENIYQKAVLTEKEVIELVTHKM